MTPTSHGEPPAARRNLFESSMSSLSSLMALQLFSRLFTFILNQALFRIVSPKAFGTAAIQFELLLSTILFLSREGVRNAILRSVTSRKGGKQEETTSLSATSSNLTLLPFLIGCPLALSTTYLYGHFAGQDTRSQPHFQAAITIYALASMVELATEPMHNRAMVELQTGIRVKAEGLGITCRTISTFVLLLLDSRTGPRAGEFALLAFALGQLVYGAAVLASYLLRYGSANLWLQRQKLDKVKFSYFEPQLLRLSLTMTSQSLVKHFLTEGDKLILSKLSPLQDQGGYAIAVNYGSLIARIVFQPIEEVARVLFSRLLAKSTEPETTNPSVRSNGRENLSRAANALISLFAVQCSLSVILVVFGTRYLPIALSALLPSQFMSTSAPQVLAAWIWYIPVLAINGTLEAFLSSASTPQDLNRQSWWMVAFSCLYISVALWLYQLGFGDVSLVYANIINLSARIGYCIHFTTSYFSRYGARDIIRWRDVLPHKGVLGAACFSLALTHYSSRKLHIPQLIAAQGKTSLLNPMVLLHIAIGGFLALFCLATWWLTSGRFMKMPHRQKQD